MSNEIAKNSVVYTPDGHECIVDTPLTTGAIVSYILTDGNDDYLGRSEPFYAPVIYTTPPVARLAKEHEGWQQSIEEAKKEFRAIRNSIETEAKVRTDLLEKLKQIPALKHIESFIDGKITHYVIKSRYHDTVSILTFAETLSDEDSYYKWRKDNTHKLLSLFGGSEGNLEWKLSDYSDGSGSWTKVYPCLSLEEARAKAHELISEDIEKFRETNGPLYLGDYFIKSCKHLDFTIPKDIWDRHLEGITKHLKDTVARKHQELYEAQLALNDNQRIPTTTIVIDASKKE